ncbi:MAG: helix-turn-helix transcriptional regulator [bacterium]|nr:helix-turn-helix transcriptional regulator [bacterium]
MNMERIGKLLRLHRKHAGLSRLRLAEIAGVGKTVVYDIEHGKETVQFAGLLKTLEALNISLELKSPVMDFLLQQDKETQKGKEKGKEAGQ